MAKQPKNEPDRNVFAFEQNLKFQFWLKDPLDIRYFFLRFATELRLQEMKDFFASRPEAGAGTASRKIALEAVENNIKFIRNYSNDIQSWLNVNVRP